MESADLRELKIFMKNLSERFYHENDLSDITYALLSTNKDFKNCFLYHCFPDDIPHTDDVLIWREKSFDNGRPDFILTSNEQKFLIEIKINDKNHHFAQYCKEEFKDYKKACIANYKITEQDLNGEDKNYFQKWKCLTWKKIYEELGNPSKFSSNPIISGYRAYLKSVCNLPEIKDMRFNSLEGLRNFKSYIEEKVNKQDNIYRLYPYEYKYNYYKDWTGRYFCMTKTGSRKSIFPWFGVYYPEDGNTKICFCFEYYKDWCDSLQNKKDDIKKDVKSKISGFAEFEDGTNYFYVNLISTKYEELQKADDITEQRNILDMFFDGVLNIICDYI